MHKCFHSIEYKLPKFHRLGKYFPNKHLFTTNKTSFLSQNRMTIYF